LERNHGANSTPSEFPSMFARPVLSLWHTRSVGAAVLAVAGLIASPPRAVADSVTLQFNQTTASAAVSVQYTIGGVAKAETAVPGPYYWTPVTQPLNSTFPNPTTTFCVELNQTISTGQQYTYTVTPLASQSGVTATEAADISKLWGAYYNSAWGSTSFAGSLQSTAFQLALWKLVYDGGTNLSLLSGDFVIPGATASSLSNTSTAAGLAQSWLNALAGTPSSIFSTNFSGEQLEWLSNSWSQDQLTMVPTPHPNVVTPAPPGVVLAGIGFLGLLGRSIRRRSAPVNA
jgi:hypothetical protein